MTPSAPVRIIGVDPGPTPGFALIDWRAIGSIRLEVMQCSVGASIELFRAWALLSPRPDRVFVQIEDFVVRRVAGKTGRAGGATRDLVGHLRPTFSALSSEISGGHWIQRNAGQVKPWATDERLDAAGLLELTKGMRHARDAARHALFCAVKDAGVPDPLSKHQPNQED